MNEAVNNAAAALEKFAAAIEQGWTGESTFAEQWGWNFSAITRHELAAIPKSLATRIRGIEEGQVEGEAEEALAKIPARVQAQNATVGNLYNGHATTAIPALLGLFAWIEEAIAPISNWTVIKDSKALPPAMARRLRAYQAELEQIAPDAERLRKQIKLINDATEAAESLPTDLQALQQAKSKIDKLSADSSEDARVAHEKRASAADALDEIKKIEAEAGKLIKQVESAYQITTTKGLAAAFDRRAALLSWSIWFWVAGLLIALGMGAHLGSERIAMLSSAVAANDPKWGAIWMHAILSLLSIGAPLWFAWLATKQIGQRFRLAEDYAYKASVAKAYEGYRREAARLDPAFEARLFSSALMRLEEAPLRLVETESHGSPWHELIGSEQFRKAMETVPDLKDKFIDIVKARMTPKEAVSETAAKPE